jgi:hypothetical protein
VCEQAAEQAKNKNLSENSQTTLMTRKVSILSFFLKNDVKRKTIQKPPHT